MPLNWLPLTSEAQVDALKSRSFEVPCLILKHSTRCEISAIAKYRLEDDWPQITAEIEPYYLDLIAYRPVSQYVADVFEVHHESPQVLLIVDGECVFDASHLDVSVEELNEALAQTTVG